MPAISEAPPRVETHDLRPAYEQHSLLSSSDGPAWERRLAKASIPLMARPGHAASEMGQPLYALILNDEMPLEPHRVLAPFSQPRSWVGEAIASFPGMREMTRGEVQSQKNFRRLMSKRV